MRPYARPWSCFPIGRFARLTGLTVRAVRHYGELGLLEPAYIDPDTGYRYDAPDQVEDVQRVAKDLFENTRLYLAVVGPFDDPARFEKLLAA